MNELQKYLNETLRDKRRELDAVERMKETIAFETAESLFVVIGIVKDMFDEEIVVGKLEHDNDSDSADDVNIVYVPSRKPNLKFSHDLSSFPYFFTRGDEAARFAGRVVTPDMKVFVKDKIVCRTALTKIVATDLKTYVNKLEAQAKSQIKSLSSILSTLSC